MSIRDVRSPDVRSQVLLTEYVEDNAIDLPVMGGFGDSRLS